MVGKCGGRGSMTSIDRNGITRVLRTSPCRSSRKLVSEVRRSGEKIGGSFLWRARWALRKVGASFLVRLSNRPAHPRP
jgi:hypothetical protein